MRKGLTAELAKLPRKRELNPAVWGLWHSTRRVHVWVDLGDGATVLHAVSVYGVVWDRAALWQDVPHRPCGLRNALHIVGADGSCPTGRMQDVLQVMLIHLLTRRLGLGPAIHGPC